MTGIIHSTKSLFKIRFLRNVLLISLIGTLSMPLIMQFVITPRFADYVVAVTEDEARRIATHLAQGLEVSSASLSTASLPQEFVTQSDQLLETLGLKKFRIFSVDGETIFSTEWEEIGEVNQKAYFQQEVMKGYLYTQLVQKSRTTAEGDISTADVLETYVPVRNPAGVIVGAIEIYFDITERWIWLKGITHRSAMGLMLVVAVIMVALYFALLYAAQITVERQKERLKLQLAADVMANTEEGILVTDAKGRIESVNQAFTEQTGYTWEEVRGKNPRFLQSGRHDKAFFKRMWEAIEEQGMGKGEIWDRRKDGEVYPEWLTINSIKDIKGRVANYVGIFLDITHFKSKENQLESLAYRDALTGLPNRLLLKDRLEQNLVAAKRFQRRPAILFLDLDGFKAVNDQRGHRVGDLLLQEAAQRFNACIREEDTLGRLGGDEFLICIRKIDHQHEIQLIAKRLISALATHELRIDGEYCKVGVSIGVSIFPEHGEDAESLIHNSDLAMYAAKQSGKNGYQIYHAGMDAEEKEPESFGGS
ncbi:MAG: diguanylate cyclase [Candidatus Thiodiazotropha sp.]